MESKTVIVLLIIAIIITGVIFGFAAISSNDSAPTINAGSNEIVFNNGDKESVLLSDVTAIDSTDGDLTNKVFVSSVIDARDNAHAIVTYCVEDSSKNVTTLKRMVRSNGTSGESIVLTVSK